MGKSAKQHAPEGLRILYAQGLASVCAITNAFDALIPAPANSLSACCYPTTEETLLPNKIQISKIHDYFLFDRLCAQTKSVV